MRTRTLSCPKPAADRWSPLVSVVVIGMTCSAFWIAAGLAIAEMLG